LLLVEEGLNAEASKYLINIKEIGDESIKQLYERLYFNCELELGNVLEKPNPRIVPIILKQNKNIGRQDKPYHQKEIRKEENQNTFKFKNPQHPKPEMFRRPMPPPHSNPMGAFRNIQEKEQEKKKETVNPPNITQQKQTEPKFNFGGKDSKITPPPVPRPPMPYRQKLNPPRNPIPQVHETKEIRSPPIKKENPPNPHTQQFGGKPIEKKEEPNNEQKLEPMSQDEETAYNYFSDMIETYNSCYKDENKRRDFGGKVNVLLKKLENHEIQNSLIRYLHDFIKLKNNNDNTGLKRLYTRIQSVDWDKNKSWMPLLDKIINMRFK
jgi:hypothetical protein